MGEEKKALRQIILQQRDLLSYSEKLEKSLVINEKFLSLKHVKNSRVIMCYMNFGSEVMTLSLIQKCFELGKKVVIPYIVKISKTERHMFVSEITDTGSQLHTGTWGIPEPKKDSIREVDPGNIDIIAVPGVVFDMKHNRIGYGAGYYDRFLNKVGDACLKVGLAYELQIIDNIPAEKHDIKMDIIITEKRQI